MLCEYLLPTTRKVRSWSLSYTNIPTSSNTPAPGALIMRQKNEFAAGCEEDCPIHPLSAAFSTAKLICTVTFGKRAKGLTCWVTFGCQAGSHNISWCYLRFLFIEINSISVACWRKKCLRKMCFQLMPSLGVFHPSRYLRLRSLMIGCQNGPN